MSEKKKKKLIDINLQISPKTISITQTSNYF